MPYYTLVHKEIQCPQWKTDILVWAKYSYNDFSDTKAKLGSVTCPILENIRKPASKKDKDLSIYAFCRMSDTCKLRSNFPNEIDL